MNQIKIGRYIQKLRKAKRLTQKELADMLQISFQAVSKWEVGETLPDTSLILKLCEILETSADMLLRGGSYFNNEKRLMSIKNVENGFKAMDDIKKYFGEDCFFYLGMIEGINKKMNMNIEEYLDNPMYKEALVTEVLLQGINSGKYYVDIEEAKCYFKNEKYLNYVISASKKI